MNSSHEYAAVEGLKELISEAKVTSGGLLVVLDPEKVIVRMDRGKHVSTLEVDIEVPNGVERSIAAAAT
jgi:hypothetical protein